MKMYCPFCKFDLAEKDTFEFWCDNCKKLWHIEILERYVC